jgi:hypothetical protein
MQHPHSFRPVRDLGVVPVSCPVKSEEPGCSSFVWLPAWLPSWLEWRTSKCRSSLGYEPSAWHVPTCSEPFSPSIRAAPGLWSFESANLDSASPSVVATSAGARRLHRGLAGWPARSRNDGRSGLEAGPVACMQAAACCGASGSLPGSTASFPAATRSGSLVRFTG